MNPDGRWDQCVRSAVPLIRPPRSLREHAVIGGNRVTAKDARLPAGSHHIRVEVADTKGRKGARDIKFTVAEDVAAAAGGAYALAPITASPACSG
jgi:hypothetical protein